MSGPCGKDSNFKGKKGRSGRKGYGIENAKKYLLHQAYWIAIKSLDKDALDMPEKEKRELAKQVVLKELGSNIDLTSLGEKIDTYDPEQIKRAASEIIGGGSEGKL